MQQYYVLSKYVHSAKRSGKSPNATSFMPPGTLRGQPGSQVDQHWSSGGSMHYHYCLKLRSKVGIKACTHLHLLPGGGGMARTVHLDKLVSKEVIGPILPDE